MRSSLCITAIAITLAMTGCGGGGEHADDVSVTPPSVTTLGSRAMPGSTITVTPETAIAAGQPLSVLIAVPDLPVGAVLTAKIGTDHDTATTTAITALPANHWRATMTLPDPLPVGTGVLVFMTLADGSVLESGREDFVLVR